MERHFHVVIFCALISLHLMLVQGARQDIKCGGVSSFFDLYTNPLIFSDT